VLRRRGKKLEDDLARGVSLLWFVAHQKIV
jgi:hypothetical protein